MPTLVHTVSTPKPALRQNYADTSFASPLGATTFNNRKDRAGKPMTPAEIHTFKQSHDGAQERALRDSMDRLRQAIELRHIHDAENDANKTAYLFQGLVVQFMNAKDGSPEAMRLSVMISSVAKELKGMTEGAQALSPEYTARIDNMVDSAVRAHDDKLEQAKNNQGMPLPTMKF